MSVDLSCPPVDVSRLTPVTLDEVLAGAAQMTRVDRKYLVPVHTAQHVVDALRQTHRLLVIDGRRSTTYRSTYLDTGEAHTARAHVQGRRRRWKARSRLYVEDQLCRLEVKTKDARGATMKSVRDIDPARYGTLLPRDTEFIAEVLRERAMSGPVAALRPTAEVTYRRITLADLDRSTRVTIDWGVRCQTSEGLVWLDEDYVLVETKGGHRPGEADLALAGRRVRPRSFSKYVAGVCLLSDGIPANDFIALLGRQLHTDRTDRTDRTSPVAAASADQRRAS
jgi:hypothetical protein